MNAQRNVKNGPDKGNKIGCTKQLKDDTVGIKTTILKAEKRSEDCKPELTRKVVLVKVKPRDRHKATKRQMKTLESKPQKALKPAKQMKVKEKKMEPAPAYVQEPSDDDCVFIEKSPASGEKKLGSIDIQFDGVPWENNTIKPLAKVCEGRDNDDRYIRFSSPSIATATEKVKGEKMEPAPAYVQEPSDDDCVFFEKRPALGEKKLVSIGIQFDGVPWENNTIKPLAKVSEGDNDDSYIKFSTTSKATATEKVKRALFRDTVRGELKLILSDESDDEDIVSIPTSLQPTNRIDSPRKENIPQKTRVDDPSGSSDPDSLEVIPSTSVTATTHDNVQPKERQTDKPQPPLKLQVLEPLDEFDVNSYHEHKHSLVNIFKRHFEAENNQIWQMLRYKPIPRFTIINCETYPFTGKQKVCLNYRPREDFPTFLSILEAFGATTSVLPSVDIETSIPILFESSDTLHNIRVAKSWMKNEKKHKRIPRDVFSESFIFKLLDDGKVDDLNLYRVGDTQYTPYDANHLLQGTLRWSQIFPLP